MSSLCLPLMQHERLIPNPPMGLRTCRQSYGRFLSGKFSVLVKIGFDGIVAFFSNYRRDSHRQYQCLPASLSFFRHRAIAHLSTPIGNPLRTLASVRQSTERIFIDRKLMMLFHIRFYALVVTHPVLFHKIAYNADSAQKLNFIKLAIRNPLTLYAAA